ncbi:MAG: site-specific integrase [Planctomycetes bacterium]|nr:site-specific integrase [Planctomycetota bacterium]
MATRPLPYVHRRQLRDGSYRYRGYADDQDGRRVFSASFLTEQEAYNAALGMRGEAKNTSDGETLFDAIEKLKEEIRTKRTSGTLRWYSDHLRAVDRLIPGETSLHRITRETVEQFVRDRLRVVDGQRKVKPATVNADLRALHRVFALAIRRGAVRENPVHQVDRPRADVPAMDWFLDDELRDLLPRLPTQRHRDVIQFLAMTGLRRSELAKLEPGHIRTKLRQLVVLGKNRTRVIPLAPALDKVCERLLVGAADGKVVPGGTHAIDDLFREAKESCGDRRLHAHALRHTFCTWLIRKGVRLDVVMRLADHRDIKTTMRYAHEVGEEGVEAVERLRLLPPASDRAAGQ